MLKNATYYKGRLDDLKIVEGLGDAESLNREVGFLSYYAKQLAGLLREDDVMVIGVDEGSQLNVIGFPGGSSRAGQKVCGILTDAPNTEIDQVLNELEWKELAQQ